MCVCLCISAYVYDVPDTSACAKATFLFALELRLEYTGVGKTTLCQVLSGEAVSDVYRPTIGCCVHVLVSQYGLQTNNALSSAHVGDERLRGCGDAGVHRAVGYRRKSTLEASA
jgi:hypothetical protein